MQENTPVSMGLQAVIFAALARFRQQHKELAAHVVNQANIRLGMKVQHNALPVAVQHTRNIWASVIPALQVNFWQ